MPEKVLVTGGAGFIGSHTVDALLARGYQVKILDNLSKPVHLKGKPDYLPEEAEFILGDVRDKKSMEDALRDVDYVFHFAAYQDYLPDFSKFFDVNSVGTALIYQIVVEYRLPVKKIIVASSQAVAGEGKYLCEKDGIVYPDMRSLEQLESGQWELLCPLCQGKIAYQPTEEQVANPQNQYAMSKYTQEMIAMNLGRRYGIPSVALRYSIVQGPRQSLHNAYSGACRIFCLSLLFNKAPVVYEDGQQIRDFINIEDVVRANLLVLEDDRANYQVFNVGGGRAYTVLAFARMVCQIHNNGFEPRITGEFRYGDTRHIFSDISKLKALGWEPRYTPDKSIRDYLVWLKKQNGLENTLGQAEQHMLQMRVVRKVKEG
ncbi:MAG: SDR family NAD(P)-dependent oxidoreductase [candidate division KSB1 bacterium]|nr:SDR family NAD(P)-dependent oxidoreductase [candidate division KSB1 bacterium]